MNPLEIEYKRAQPHLGTIVSIHLYSLLQEDLVESKISEAFEELKKWEAIFNFHSPNSTLSQWNAAGIGEPFLVPKEFYHLVHLALKIFAVSNGAFTPFTFKPD